MQLRQFIAQALVGLLLVGPLSAATDPATGSRGYEAVDCGFDLDRDGIIGEAADDCTICDDTSGASAPMTEDLFGDATLESQWYVDTATGTDNGSCGSPDSPCATIDYAANTRANTGDGSADIICFTGSDDPDRIGWINGITGTWTRTKTGNMVRDWVLSSEPSMLVGWDTDGDDSYPPFDSDDSSIIDGNGNRAVFSDAFTEDYVEFAHFEVREYGDGTDFAWMGVANSDYVYEHDIEFYEMQQAATVSSPKFAEWGSTVTWHVRENIFVESGGFYIHRGFPCSTQGTTCGPFVFHQYTLSGKDVADDEVNFWDLTGRISGLDVVDSTFDSNIPDWDTGDLENIIGMQLNSCVQDVNIINTKWVDFTDVFSINGSSGFCTSGVRETCADCTFDRNEFVWDADFPNFLGRVFWFYENTSQTDSHVDGDIFITNNVAYNTSNGALTTFITEGRGWSAGVTYTGTMYVVGNTIISTDSNGDGFSIFNWDGSQTIKPDNYELKNNIVYFGSDTGRENIEVDWAPSGFVAEGNVWASAGTFQWNGGTVRSIIDDWQDDLGGCPGSGNDCDSFECVPSFVNTGTYDFHLASGDTCAKDQGVDISSITTVDYDNQVRDDDIGADEEGASGVDPPLENGCCLGWLEEQGLEQEFIDLYADGELGKDYERIPIFGGAQ